MTTTTKTADFVGRVLTTPDSDARDYLGRATIVGDRDFLGRSLTGGGGGDVQALLDEAAVRFDFSQYDDIEDMVDVNGGWGPLNAANATFDSHEFTVDGLRVVNASSGTLQLRLDGVAGPAVFGPDGLTEIQVSRVDVPSGSFIEVAWMDLAADANNNYAPELVVQWTLTPDTQDGYGVGLYDVAPGGSLVDHQSEVTDQTPNGTTGVFMMIAVVDVDALEVRVALVSPDRRFDHTFAMTATPTFATTPAVIDGLVRSTVDPPDLTVIEDDIWNRALTSTEVDALVAHFTEGG